MILYVKMNSKRIKDFELQNETLENIGKYFFNFVMWTAFLNMTKKTEKPLRKNAKKYEQS